MTTSFSFNDDLRIKAPKIIESIVLFPICVLPIGFGFLYFLPKMLIALAVITMFFLFFSSLGKKIFGKIGLILFICFILIFQGYFLNFIYDGNDAPGAVIDGQFFIYAFLLLFFSSVYKVSTSFVTTFFLMLDWSFLVFILDLSLVFFSEGTIFSSANGSPRLSPSLGPSAGGIYLMLIFLVSLVRWFFFKKNTRLFFLAFISFLIYLTSTRIILVGCLVCVFYLLWTKKTFGLNFKTLIFIFVGLFFLSSLYSRLFFSIDSGASGEINTNGRSVMWADLFDVFLTSPIFGSGFGRSVAILSSSGFKSDFGIQPHNDYLRIVISLGIFGFIYFFILFLILWKKLKPGVVFLGLVDMAIMARLLIIGFLTVMLTDNIFIYHFYIYPMLIIIMLGINRRPNNRYVVRMRPRFEK